MQEKRKEKRRKDLIQVILLIALLFSYAHYETKRKEEAHRYRAFASFSKTPVPTHPIVPMHSDLPVSLPPIQVRDY